jgi:O-antigen ligase
MDAVINGLIGGGTASLLLIVGGAVALYSDLWQKVSSPQLFFAWLCLLSAFQVGQLYLLFVLVSDFAATPSQTDKAVVK